MSLRLTVDVPLQAIAALRDISDSEIGEALCRLDGQLRSGDVVAQYAEALVASAKALPYYIVTREDSQDASIRREDTNLRIHNGTSGDGRASVANGSAWDDASHLTDLGHAGMGEANVENSFNFYAPGIARQLFYKMRDTIAFHERLRCTASATASIPVA